MSAMVLGCLLAFSALFGTNAPGPESTAAAPQAARTQDEGTGLVAYAGTDGNIWVTDPEGREPRQVTTTGTSERPLAHPRWSPDGTALVFAEGRNGEGIDGDGVYLAREGVVTQIAGVTGCGFPTFLPDGEHLLYACGIGFSGEDPPSAEELATDPALGFISTSRLDGSKWQVLVPYTLDGGGFPDWNWKYGRSPITYMSNVSPDGTVLLSVLGMVGSMTIWELDIEDGTLGVLDLPLDDEPPVEGSQVYRDVSPVDGEKGILAVRCRGACTMGSGVDHAVTDVVTVNPDTGAIDVVLTLPQDTFLNAPSFDPIAGRVIYQSRYANEPAVWMSAVPDGTPKVIAAGSDPTWQPVAIAFVAPNISAPVSADVPMYRMSAAGVGEQPGPAPLDAPGIQWRVPLGSEASGSPAIADEVLYVTANDGSVHAIDPITGEERWQMTHDYLRVVTSPAVGGGAIYVSMAYPTSAARNGTVMALDKRSGTQLWEFFTKGRPVGSPVVSDFTLHVGTDDGFLYGLDTNLGTESWRFDAGFAVTASPAVADGTVFVSTADGVLHAVDADTGTERWQFATGMVQPLSAPTVADGVVHVGGADGVVYAVDYDTGEELWLFDTGGAILADSIVADGVLYVGSDSGHLFALDAATGSRRWSYDAGSAARTTPSATADTVVFGTMDGALHAVDTATGAASWRFETDHYAMSPALIVGGVVYFGSGDGFLYAIGSGE
jgi:outer membrane protein assembly factor BamB